MLDISRIAQAALSQARTLLPAWLPGGKWDGREWRCGDLSGKPGKSFGANSDTGRWSDFASGESGGDLVSLYAAIHGVGQGEAAFAVAVELGIDTDTARPSGPQRRQGESRAARTAAEAPRGQEERKTEWRPVVPVPDDAAPLPLAHPVRGAYQAIWRYYDQKHRLVGAVCRFATSDGGKEILPLVWCTHPKKRPEWRWLQWDEPRPLYVAEWWSEGDTRRAVLVVEGEKCAVAAVEQLGSWVHVVSWPGGGKAVHKADWSWIAGRRVILWPDADAKRDKHTHELLPAEKQPGIATMHKLAGILAGHGCTVRLVDIPPPGEKPDGWDVADAVAEGQDGETLKAWILDRLIEPPAQSAPPAPPDPPRAPPPSGGSDRPSWWDVLITNKRGDPADCRENVMLVLTHHPVWEGALGYNQFAARTESLRRTPWGTGPGEWTTADDRELGLWLAQGVELLIRSEANISAGVEMAAMRAPYHPVLQYLDGLKWDGTDRLSYWLQECLGVEDSPYVRLAGAFFLRSMVARVWKPGAQVDHMLVLEGGQGEGKSSALRVLAGQWFSDTQFRLGDKDALLQLEDVWLYEVSELDAFSRADTTAVKQFLTTLNDKFRGVYERRTSRRPRQVVMGGTTNQDKYLRDQTGNRRFWPVSVGRIDLDLLRQWRDHLFAQAYSEVKAGARWWPTRQEERDLFMPAQDNRVIVDPWADELSKRLQDIKWADRYTFTAAELLGVLGVSADKIDAAGAMAKRVTSIMHSLGWRKGRERRPDGTRPHVWVKPGHESSVQMDQGAVAGPAPDVDGDVPL